MNNYIFFRKIHRVFVLVTAVSILLMGITGIFLKYQGLANIFGFDLSFVRMVHNQASPFSALFLLIMAFSGTMMYLIPLIKMRKNNTQKEQV